MKKKDALAYLPELRKEITKRKTAILAELHEIFTDTKKYEKLSNSQKKKLGLPWKRLSDISFFDINNL